MRWKFGLMMYVVVVGIVLSVTSCASKVYFTEFSRMKSEKVGLVIQDLQFYNDKEMLLRRKTTSKELIADNGVVNKLEGVRVQDIRVRRSTAMRVDSMGKECIYVRFEVGDGQTLKFYKNQFNHYQLHADSWLAGRGHIVYGDKNYVIERAGNDCLLMVKNSQKFRSANQRRVVRGVDVNEIEIRDTIPEDLPQNP